MTTVLTRAALAVCLAVAAASGAAAQSQGGADHGAMGHGAMAAPQTVAEADVAAVIHSVDVDAGVITVTHAPVEALGWPQMTMDLPVANRVDVASAPLERPVTLTLKRGRDNVFRVMEIKPAP